MLNKQKKEILITFGLLAITSFLAAKPSYAGPGQWWVKMDQTGIFDTYGTSAYGSGDSPYDLSVSPDDKDTGDYVQLTSEDAGFGLHNDPGYLPYNVPSGDTLELSVGDQALFPTSTANFPMTETLKFKWLDSTGGPASDSPPSSISFTVRSTIGAGFELYQGGGTNTLINHDTTSYAAFRSAVGSYDTCSYISNGLGDSAVETYTTPGIQITSDGSHLASATVVNGEATYDIHPELHFWLQNTSVITDDIVYQIGLGGSVTVHS